MDGRPTWTNCDEAGDYVVPNVLSPRDLIFRPDNMDETSKQVWSCWDGRLRFEPRYEKTVFCYAKTKTRSASR